MEKKNTILLTVIAIATLLVAVVGATFAYFTATVTTDKDEAGNNTATVTTQALASAVMEMGSKVEATGVYPGFKAVKSVTVTGSCPNSEKSCKAVDATIKVTPTIDPAFGSDVTWTLYKSTTPIKCTGNNSIVNGENGEVQHSANYDCPIPEGAEEVIAKTNAAGSKDVSVDNNTNDTYYLVVEYANNAEAAQNAAQGKSFSVALDFVPTTK